MPRYRKPFLTIEEQIALLEKRGLKVGDKKGMDFFLRNVSYYHLSIYSKAFQNKANQFNDGVSFDDIIHLYEFDKKLRLLLLDMLERIEMSLKCVLAYEVTNSKKDIYWYKDKNNFLNNNNGIRDTLNDIRKSKEIYIRHYYETYTEPSHPPAWMFFESLTFGQCTRLARALHDNDRQIIAGYYRLPKKTTIQMFSYLYYLRNACAHHARIWNREFVYRVGKHAKYEHIYGDTQRRSLFAYLVVMQIFLKRINPTSQWIMRLNDLIEQYKIDINRMGFPNDWYKKLNTLK